MVGFKYSSWKSEFLLVFILTTILRTDCLEIKRLNNKKFDARLCPNDEVSNITHVYVGGKLTNNQNRNTDYRLEINSTTLNDVFKETLDKCNGTPVCQGTLYAIDRWQYTTIEGQVDITYQVIQYNCVSPDTDYTVKYVSNPVPSYLTIPPCPFWSRITVDDVYSGKHYSSYDCVTDLIYGDRKLEIKRKCDGKTNCDNFYINGIYINCKNADWAKYIIIKYHCTPYGNGNDLFQLTCEKSNRRIRQNISCSGNDTTITIRDILIGYSNKETCNFTEPNCIKSLGDKEYYDIKKKCNGKSHCQVNIQKYNHKCGKKEINYLQAVYDCKSEWYQKRFCINERIILNCSDGNVIYIKNLFYGDYKYYTRCESLNNDITEWKREAYCEKNVTLYNMTFYSEVISSCNGKTQCDESLRAIAGPSIGPCYDNVMRLPDYVVVDYFCEPAVEYTTESTDFTTSLADHQQTREAPSGVVTDKGNQTSNPAQTGSSSSNLIIYTVPVVLLIVLVITVTIIFLVYRMRRNLAESKSEQNLQTLGNVDVCYEQAESVTIAKRNTTDQNSDNTEKDTGLRNVSAYDTDPGVMYENALFVAERNRNQINEGSKSDIYTEVDKAKVKKKHQKIEKSKDTVDSAVYSLAKDGATSVVDAEGDLYDTVKDERNVIVDDTTVVDNVGYVRH